ncbi:MAG TPA: hypothetical protein VKA88_02470 [Solirubrobacterales bacterium]|nr:hypothetical protein [Solirubrobacterales bacterium]
MGRRRTIRELIALAIIGAALGVAAPAGVGQTADCIDPNYCPQETAPVNTTGQLSQKQLRKRCIVKAQNKFGNNKPRLKKAIKKCKKKFPLT